MLPSYSTIRCHNANELFKPQFFQEGPWNAIKFFCQKMFSWSIWWVFPGGSVGKEHAWQSRRLKKCGFDPWVGKIPWNRSWQPTPVSLPGKVHGQWSLAGYGPWTFKGSDRTEHSCTQYPVCCLAMFLQDKKFVTTQCFFEEVLVLLFCFSYIASDNRSIKNFKTVFRTQERLTPICDQGHARQYAWFNFGLKFCSSVMHRR